MKQASQSYTHGDLQWSELWASGQSSWNLPSRSSSLCSHTYQAQFGVCSRGEVLALVGCIFVHGSWTLLPFERLQTWSSLLTSRISGQEHAMIHFWLPFAKTTGFVEGKTQTTQASQTLNLGSHDVLDQSGLNQVPETVKDIEFLKYNCIEKSGIPGWRWGLRMSSCVSL